MALRHPLLLTASVVSVLLMLGGCGGDSPTAPSPGPGEGPVIQSVTPNTGPIHGGTALTIRGARFAAGAQVTIGGRAALDVNVEGPDVITAKSPAAPAPGAADVVVALGGRSTRLPGGFTYVAAPQNAAPDIESLTARGTRPQQPANFADLGESIRVTATVTDEETDPDDLEYEWSATLGTFSGSGREVTWRAPASAETPATVTVTLKVIERYGADRALVNEATRTQTISLHDSETEVGDMARRFLTEFSKPQTNKDADDIMADFDRGSCPDPSLVDDEREDVIEHYTHFVMHAYSIGDATVEIRFDDECAVPGRSSRPGDACVTVPVQWDSTDTRTGDRAVVTGTDYLSAVYSSTHRRWWLCSSDFRSSSSTSSLSFYER
ncbi:MAG TPA: IPT/TIG domain-containing protein [Vicinamibacterales bacterium]|nr:IPT/TIG domain-containing protein [Vicinamibacterales bacterium]